VEERSQLPVTPTELQKLRFDYAWKWFNFHAEQRTKMFNFMLLGMGIFATALVTAIDKGLALEAATLGTAAVVVAIVFVLIDRRNKQLYSVAMDVLIDAEKTVVFGNGITFRFDDGDATESAKPFGISRRVAIEDGKPPETLAQLRRGILKGQHRYLMPFVAWGFALLFGLAAMRAWLVYLERSPYWPVMIGSFVLVAGGAIALVWVDGPMARLLAWLGLLIGLAGVLSAFSFEGLKTPMKAVQQASGHSELQVIERPGIRAAIAGAHQPRKFA
jgi:hypothetical protein